LKYRPVIAIAVILLCCPLSPNKERIFSLNTAHILHEILTINLVLIRTTIRPLYKNS